MLPRDPRRALPCYPGAVLRIPVLAAPTASGKSEVALALAERLGLELVSADAMQVYRGMDIGTAKPSAAERERVRHHLIDVVAPDEPFSVADWVPLAEAAISGALARGRLPLVVGGTGFYLRALAEGLPGAPAADAAAQAPLWARLEREGLDPLLHELEAASPEDAARAQRNPRRVVRALEILARSGRPPSAFAPVPPAHRYQVVTLLPEAAALEPRIAARTEAMFDRGLVEEVSALLARYPAWPTARQAIGYKEVAAFLAGDLTLAEAKAAVMLATTRYAKRQRTFFRRWPRAPHLRLAATAPAARAELAAWLEPLAPQAAALLHSPG